MTIAGRTIPPSVLRVVQTFVALGMMAILWHTADGPEALRILADAAPLWLVAAFAALTLQTILSALRWRLTAGQLGIRLRRGEAVRESYLAQIVNQTLPGGLVGDAARAVRARAQAGLLAAGQSVVFERLAGQVAMFLAMAFAFLVTFSMPGGFDWPGWLVPTVTLLVAAGILAPLVLIGTVWLPGMVGRGMSGFWRALRVALVAPQVLPGQIVLSIGTTACNLAAFAFCARAVGAPLPLIAVVALVPLILFTMLIPLSFSGWGLREGAAAALFPVAGLSAAQGLASSVAFGLVFLIAVLPGLVPLWLRPPGAADTR